MNRSLCFPFRSISIVTVCLLGLLGSSALAQTTAPFASEEPRSETLVQPSTRLSEDELESQIPATDRPSCPEGQFASAFPDVRPDDWAYEAVNRLAIGPIRCFPLNSQSSIERQ
jgi:hypothetical protein